MRLEPPTYALTAVCHERRRIFQRTTNAELLIAMLLRYREQGRFLLHGFVIMPEHLHVLLTPFESIEKAAQLIKGGFSFAVRKEFSGMVWQDGYHEHRIRDGEDYRQQLAYIANNPVKRGLSDYPHVHTRHVGHLDKAPRFVAG